MFNPLNFWKLSKPATARRVSLGVVGLLGALLLVACGDSAPPLTPVALSALNPTQTPVPATPLPNNNPAAFGATTITAELVGGGSTLGEPVYTKWLAEYKKVAPNIKITYQATGSGNGRSAFLGTPVAATGNSGRVISPSDFAGSDATFNGSQFVDVTAKGEVVHIPTVLGAVVVSYRLDGYTRELRLSGPTLAKIFLGDIKTWNDPAITAENGNVVVSTKPISVVIRTRTASSGTSEIFSRYLSAVSTDFRDRVIVANTDPAAQSSLFSRPKWPALSQLEGDSNDTVASAISGRDGTIGYLDQGAADEKKLPYASMRNNTGRFIAPTVDSVTAAAQGVSIPDDFRVFVVNPDGETAYPIAGFTWLIVWKDAKNMPNASKEKAQAMVNFLWWGLHDGQKNLPSGFAPLPSSLIPRLESVFVNNDQNKVFRFQGQPIFTAPK